MAASKVSVKVITWEGYPSVENVVAYRKELLEAFDAYAQVVLSLSLLEGMDLSILQLVKAAFLEAKKRGKSFHLSGMIKPELSRVLVISGFSQGVYEDARDLEQNIFRSEDNGKSV